MIKGSLQISFGEDFDGILLDVGWFLNPMTNVVIRRADAERCRGEGVKMETEILSGGSRSQES